jgi:hypothetical protein
MLSKPTISDLIVHSESPISNLRTESISQIRPVSRVEFNNGSKSGLGVEYPESVICKDVTEDYGLHDKLTLHVLECIGEVYIEMRMFLEAETVYEILLDRILSLYGERSGEIVGVFTRIAEVKRGQGEYKGYILRICTLCLYILCMCALYIHIQRDISL